MKNFLLLLTLFSFWGCNQSTEQTKYLPMRSAMLPFSVENISVEGDMQGFDIVLSSEELAPGLDIVTVKMSRDIAATPPKVTLLWEAPSSDIAKNWNPTITVDRVGLSHHIKSSSTHYAPVCSYMNMNDENRFTVAVSDALNKIVLGAYIKEEDAKVHFYVEFFDERYPEITEYETQIMVDRRGENFARTLEGVTNWWATFPNYTPTDPPADAFRPLYSTWYSYHQNLDVDAIVEECRMSKEMGIDAVIVDDGWQTFDSQRGYAFTGDWEPVRIPEMNDFVSRVHDLDMEFMLWYSVLFIGKNAKNFSRFEDKYLYY